MSGLDDIREAKAEWASALVRERRARTVLALMVEEAREDGLKLGEIAAELGCSRQYVHKMLRGARKEAEAAEAEASYYARKTRADEREQLRGLGFTAKDRQCGVCHRFKPAPSSRCDYCGDDPVVNAGGDPDRIDRMRHDASYAGGMR